MHKRWPWCERVEHVLLGLVALLTGSILVSVTAQVLSRVLGVAFLVWMDEVTRIAVVWITFLGSAIGIRRKAHFVIELFVDALPVGVRRWVRRGIWVAVSVAVLILVRIGGELSLIALHRAYPITRISQTWAFAAMPVGAALMLVFLLEQLVAGEGEAPATEVLQS